MDHDRLFKELLTTYFFEFLDLFFPDLIQYLNRDSIEFLDKEVFTDVTEGERREVDLVVKVSFRYQPAFFLIHVENQAQPQAEFARRMFSYFARLHDKHRLAVYPIALFSYDQPLQAEPDEYRVEFSDLQVLTFRFRVVQLNRLDWHSFVERTNPIAAALMAKMRIEPTDRPQAKLACLSLLAKLQLNPARRALISGFVDTYLRLTMDEEKLFQEKIAKVEPKQREQVMEIVTSWMEAGERGLVLRQLRKRFGVLNAQVESRIVELPIEKLERLGEALLDFTTVAELTDWLDIHSTN